MAATSPYSGNDYQAVSNFRPYELPVNDIFKAISAQNSFWDAGAAKVKSVYDTALNLKLSLEPNKEIRKRYMEDSEKQLTKLSAMDLADPSVQRQGFSLFKPLFQDEGIIYDDLTSRHYDKVRQDALMYRSKDNGKGYSDVNLQYAMDGYSEFVNSKDRMAGKQFYENRKEYTPYYDYTEDFSKALKDCKPSSLELQPPVYGANNSMTGYMKESYSKVLSSAQVRGCLEAGLSPNGKRQLQIEGSVSYKNNLPILARDTVSYLSGVTGNLSSELQELAAQKHAISGDKKMSEKDRAAALEAIDNQMKGTREELDKTNYSVSKLNAGDYTEIQNDFDTYAGSVFSYRKLLKKALASSFTERREIYKGDPVQLNAITFSQNKYLNELDFNQAVSLEQMKEIYGREMKMIELMYGNKGSGSGSGGDIFRDPVTGQITINPNLMREQGNLTDKPSPDNEIYQKLNNQVASLNNEDNSNNLRLFNNLVVKGDKDKVFRETLLKGFNYGVTDDEWNRFKNGGNRFGNIQGDPNRIGGIHETSWFKAYVGQKPDDEDINKWAYNNTQIKTGVNVLNRKMELAEKEVQKMIGTDFDSQKNSRLNKIAPITTNGMTITPQTMQSVVEGKAVTGITVDMVDVMGVKTPIVKVNGVANKNATYLYQQVKEKNSIPNSIINKARVQVYNQLGFDREPWYFTPNDKAPLIETLKAILPKDDKGKSMEISIISSDFTGGVKISVPGVKKGKDSGNVLTMLRNAGVGTSAEATDDGVVTIKGTTYNVLQQAVNNPILQQAAYQMATIAETAAFQQTQNGAKVPNSDIDVPVLMRGKMENLIIETYKNDTNPEYRVYLKDGTDPRPVAVATNAYDLFEQIGKLPFDLNKPIK